jgi:hypothetical protein
MYIGFFTYITQRDPSHQVILRKGYFSADIFLVLQISCHYYCHAFHFCYEHKYSVWILLEVITHVYVWVLIHGRSMELTDIYVWV